MDKAPVKPPNHLVTLCLYKNGFFKKLEKRNEIAKFILEYLYDKVQKFRKLQILNMK